MSLQEYLGNKLYTDIRNQAITESEEFIKQSGATKLALVDKIKLENSMMKQGVNHLINVIDDVAAENELLEKKNHYYEKTFGEISKEFIHKDELTVVRTEEKTHAKNALAKYVRKYESEKDNDENKKIQPSPQGSNKVK